MSQLTSFVLAERLATYVELDSVLGLEDVLNIVEVYQVHEYNKRLVEKYGRQRS